MKSQTQYLTFNLPQRMGFVNITPQVEAIVAASGVREGCGLSHGKKAVCHWIDQF
jgi:thiamine phosphate synthase YjbQ (UPF0047 family)